MHARIILIVFCIFLLCSCGRAASIAETTAVSESIRKAPVEPSESQTSPTEPFPIVQLPGMIASDVHVCLWDGDTSPGLRAEDAQIVKQILSAQTWGDSFDNLSDVWIEVEYSVRYAYDTRTGILTAADDRAAKLSESERRQMNAILEAYLPVGEAKDDPAMQ